MFLIDKSGELGNIYEVGEKSITLIPYLAKALLDNLIIRKDLLALCHEYRYASYKLMKKTEFLYEDFLKNFPLDYEMEIRKVIGILNIAFDRRIYNGKTQYERYLSLELMDKLNNLMIKGWSNINNKLRKQVGDQVDLLDMIPILRLGILSDGNQREINEIPVYLMLGAYYNIDYQNKIYFNKYMEDSMVLYRLNNQDYAVFSKENFLKDKFLLAQCKRIRSKYFSYLDNKSLIDVYYSHIDDYPDISTTMALTESELGFIGSKFDDKNLKIRPIDIDYLIAQYLMSVEAVEEKFKSGDNNKYFETISVDKSKIDEKNLTGTVISGLITNLLIKTIKDNREYHLDNREEKLYYRVEELETENEVLQEGQSGYEKQIDQLEFQVGKLRNEYKANLERENIRLEKEKLSLEEELEAIKRQLMALENMVLRQDQTEDEEVHVLSNYQDLNGIMVGGYNKLHREIEAEVPSLLFIDADNDNYDTNILLNKEYIYIYTPYISHSLYYKTINVCRSKKLNVVYINETSVDGIVRNIYKNIN